MSALTDPQRDALRSWAARYPHIRRVVLFGSRVKGTHHPDSDLDIAVELEPGEDSNATLAKWMHFSSTWRDELGAIVPFSVDLQWLDTLGTTTTVLRGVSDASDSVYERAS